MPVKTIVLMEMRRLLFISSFLISFWAVCQEADSVTKARTIRPSIYFDYGKLLTLPTKFEKKYEGGLILLLKEKIPIILEVGAATLTPEGAYSNGVYESRGTYYRLGAGYSNAFTAKNRIGLSFRYASSSFEETGRIFIESPSSAQDPYIQNISRSNLQAQWWEFVLSTDQRVLRESDLLTVGLNLRLRILQSYDEQENVDVYAIPGYGRSFDKTIPAANFFLRVNF